MNNRLKWLVLLLFSTLIFALTAAPALSQEKARLVNPKKKKAVPAETAPAEEATPPTEPSSEPVEAAEAAVEEAEEPEIEATVSASPETVAEPASTRSAAREPEPKKTKEPKPKKAKEPRPAAPATSSVATRPAPDRSTSDRTPPPARAADQVRETIVVSEVLLDVLVTDKKGNVVTGLGADDFVIIEEGKQVPVTSSTFYGTEAELRGSGVEGEKRSDRYFILVIHDQRQILPELTGAQIDLSRRAATWVDTEMQPNDQVAVLSYDNRLKLYQDFTRDPEALKDAIKKAALGKKDLDLYKTVSAPEFDPDSPSLFVNLPSGKTLSKETRKVQQALGLIGRAAQGIVGRKNLMFFSLGWDDPDPSSSGWIPDQRYYPDMMESLNAGNVAVYSIDLLGARRGAFAGSTSLADSLSSISNDTGGYYYYNFSNALTPIRQVADDNLGYYLLSYSTEYPTGTKGYREVKVETKNGDYKVRARKGYRYGRADS